MVAQVEEVAYQHAGGDDRAQQRPAVGVAVGHRVVVADHDQQHRQREVVVVHGALLGLLAVDRIRRFTLLHRFHQLALARDDQHQHIPDHHRADHGADMDIGRAAAQELGQHVGHGHDEDEHDHAQQAVLLAQRRAAQRVVEDPAHQQRTQAHADRLQLRQVRDRLIDHHRRGVEVVDDEQQREAGDPGGVCLPFEPVQVRRQFGRRHQVFLRVVKTATMHGPQLAGHALPGQVRTRLRRTNAVIQPNKVEGCADPRDPRDQMQPAHQ